MSKKIILASDLSQSKESNQQKEKQQAYAREIPPSAVNATEGVNALAQNGLDESIAQRETNGFLPILYCFILPSLAALVIWQLWQYLKGG
jgi:hypothetical protein